jgi:hypothetical protein
MKFFGSTKFSTYFKEQGFNSKDLPKVYYDDEIDDYDDDDDDDSNDDDDL